MEQSKPKIEPKEKEPDFELAVCLTRHGPKEGTHGPLSEEGEKITEDYFTEAYENVPIDERVRRKVISSPEERTVKTADTYQRVLEKNQGINPVETELVDFLNEGNLMSYYETLRDDKEKREKWIEYIAGENNDFPPGAPDLKPIVKNFSVWLVNEIKNIKKVGGQLDIAGFSHGPVIGAVLLYIQKELGIEILSPLPKKEYRKDKLSIKNLFGEITELTSINLFVSSKNPDTVKLYALGKSVSVPLSIFEKLAEGN